MSWILFNKIWMNGTRVDFPLALLDVNPFRLVLMGRWHLRHADEKIVLQLNGLQGGYLSYTGAEGTFTQLATDFTTGMSAEPGTPTRTDVSTIHTGFSLGRVGVQQDGDFFADYIIGAVPANSDPHLSPPLQGRLGHGHSLFAAEGQSLIRSTAFGQGPCDAILSLAQMTLLCNYGGTFVGQVNLYRDGTVAIPSPTGSPYSYA